MPAGKDRASAILGLSIRRERLRRNWSQEGLCRGICAVSYLSKIEQGKADVSRDILRLLLERLELPWYGDGEEPARLERQVEALYEALLSGGGRGKERFRAGYEAMAGVWERLRASPLAADALVLTALYRRDAGQIPPELEPYLDGRQLAFVRILQGRNDEAIALSPHPYFYLMAGIAAYEAGKSYAAALAYLQRCYDLAAQEGWALLMLEARLYMGNCYCNQVDVENMQAQYAVARRLARELGEEDALESLRYNEASALLEAGEYDRAYAYFSTVEDPGVMGLHKLAICCEKRGDRGAALAALDRAEQIGGKYDPECPDQELALEMCRVVRFRLEHRDYLGCPDYGAMLLSCFRRCRRELPVGYASFHLPWVAEWHTANRQYRQAYELVKDFPFKIRLE